MNLPLQCVRRTLGGRPLPMPWRRLIAAHALGAVVALCPTVLFGQVDVPANWPLIPSGLVEGDQFRLLLVTARPYAATERDLSHYDGLIQDLVASKGHEAIKPYADQFKVLGSSSTVNARTHTETTGYIAVPIYWLNGAKLASNYTAFYNENWNGNKNPGYYQTGNPISGNSRNQIICTGSTDSGQMTFSPLGGNGNGGGEATATTINITSSTLGGGTRDVTDPCRYFGLSSVFRVGTFTVPVIVADGVTISSSPGADGDYVVGDKITVTVTFSEAVTVTGRPRIKMKLRGGTDKQPQYVAGQSTSTVLVFSYTVKADDFSAGISFAENGLRLNGGTIRAGTVDAVLEHPAIGPLSEHQIHVRPVLTSLGVTSTPGNGQAYVTGETLQVTATFDKAVKVVGTPMFQLDLDTGTVPVEPAGTVDGNQVQFDYTIGPGDYNEDLLGTASNPIPMQQMEVIVHSMLSDAAASSSDTWADVSDTPFGPSGPVNTHRPVIVADGVKLTSTPVADPATYGLGETIEVTVTFSAPVFVDMTDGIPYLEVRLKTADSTTYNKAVRVKYASGSGTSALVFHYSVKAADRDDNGLRIRPNSLLLNGGTIRDRVATDSAATDADLGHLAPGENNGDFPDHKVDGSLSSSTNRAPTFSAASHDAELHGDGGRRRGADRRRHRRRGHGRRRRQRHPDLQPRRHGRGRVHHRSGQRPDPDQGRREVRLRGEGELHGHRHGRRQQRRHGHDHRHDQRRRRRRGAAHPCSSERLVDGRHDDQSGRELDPSRTTSAVRPSRATTCGTARERAAAGPTARRT